MQCSKHSIRNSMCVDPLTIETAPIAQVKKSSEADEPVACRSLRRAQRRVSSPLVSIDFVGSRYGESASARLLWIGPIAAPPFSGRLEYPKNSECCTATK